MSSENSVPQKLKFNLLFVKIDAEGNEAIQAANRPLLILASAVSLALLITVLSASHPEWKMLFARPLGMLGALFGAS